MWKFLIYILTILTFPSLIFAQPNIVFEEETFDFGNISGDESIEHTFEFINKGNETLIIKEILPT